MANDKTPARRPSTLALATIGVLCLLLLLMPWRLTAEIVFALVCVWFMFHLLISAVGADFEPFLLTWILVFPLGYYFLSFPRERPLFTFDRAIIALLALGMAVASRRRTSEIPRELRSVGIAWACFLVAAALSLIGGQGATGAARTLVEAFLMPALLGLYVVRNFRVRENLQKVHILVCFVSIYLAAIGALEMYWGEDLLPLPDAGTYFANSPGFQLLRVNGPFLSNTSFGLIGLIAFFLLIFLKRAETRPLPLWHRCLHVVGVGSALVVSLLPLFRSIALTLLLIFLFEIFRTRARVWRVALVSLGIVSLVAFFWLSAQLPDLYEERVSGSENIYARVAQEQQSIDVFLSHPMMGVGLNNFHDAALKTTNYATSYKDVEALDYPHSNLSATLAETGIVGFIPYVLSQVLLVIAFLRIRKKGTPSARLASKCFFWIFLSYWVSGLSLTSGYYSDLNLWFVFSVALLYKYGASEVATESQPIGADET
jgi:O-antigen ligase